MKLSEISSAERKRQRKDQAIKNRELEQLKAEQEKLRLKRNLEFKTKAAIQIPQAQIKPKEKGIFASPEFDLYRTDNDIESGVYLKFEPYNNRLYTYWSTKYNRPLEVIQKTTGLYKDLGAFSGSSQENANMIKLINDITGGNDYLHIVIDKQSLARYPGLKKFADYVEYLKKITKWGKRIDNNKKLEELITIEFV